MFNRFFPLKKQYMVPWYNIMLIHQHWLPNKWPKRQMLFMVTIIHHKLWLLATLTPISLWSLIEHESKSCKSLLILLFPKILKRMSHHRSIFSESFFKCSATIFLCYIWTDTIKTYWHKWLIHILFVLVIWPYFHSWTIIVIYINHYWFCHFLPSHIF